MADVEIKKRVIEEQVVPDKRLGRHVEHDPRSVMHVVSPLLPEKVTLRTRYWYTDVVYNQGNIGACTGYASAGMCHTSPIYGKVPVVDRSNIDGLKIYELDTQLDDIPGQYPPDDTGSSGLAAMKACQQLGLITSYKWSLTMDQLLGTLSNVGPVCIGVDWYEGFDNPVPSTGLVTPSGQIRGGHEIRVIGINTTTKQVRLVNSWGLGWGQNGRFSMTWDTLEMLMGTDGDAVVGLRQ